MVAGRFRLLELIGSGGMGIVWLAFDTVEPRQVALKRPHTGGGPGMREQLLREAEVAARVAHPNAIKVFDVVVDRDACWLVMEYFNGASLAELLDRQTMLAPLRVAGLGAQVAAALTAAHAVEVVHRDVTPANILVAENGSVKVTDYGISAWRAATVTSSGKISGTAAYVSPEVANGSGAKAPSDVYSLGATLFAAVEGAPPCGTGDPEVVLARLRDGMISPVQRAGPLAPVLAALLHPDPRRRPTAAQATDMLGTIAQGREVPEWVPPAVSEPRTTPLSRGSFLRRPSVLVTLAAAVVVVVSLVIVLPLWRGDDPPAKAGGGQPAPNLDIAPVLGDPRTADPCALVVPEALERFGDTELDPDYGGFNRCDVVVGIQGDGLDETVDVELQLYADGVGEPDPDARLSIMAAAADGQDECVSSLVLADGNRVEIAVDPPEELEGKVDMCAMAAAAADAAATRMADGPLPRRGEGFPPKSLANLDACGLLDATDLAALDGAAPEPGYENWTCDWEIEDGELSVLLEHSSPVDPPDGADFQQIGSHQTFVEENGYDEGACLVTLVHREYRNYAGQPRVELVLLNAKGDYPMEQLCGMASTVAPSVESRLP